MQQNLHLVVTTAIIVKNENPPPPATLYETLRAGQPSFEKGGRKYLIIKRAPHEKVYPNKWTVPGGKLKPKDYLDTPKTTADAWYGVVDKDLRREIKEECNLEVGELNYLCDLAFVRPDDIPVLTLSFWAEYKSGEVKLEYDFTDYFWGTIEELKDYDLIEGIYDEIKMADEKLRIKN
jgi:8-oxo-dGTP pyrophosphatase MutT (NUDIX family)